MKSNKTQTKKSKLVKCLVMMVILLLMLSNVAAANPFTDFLNGVKDTAKAAREALEEIGKLVKEGHKDLKELGKGAKEDFTDIVELFTPANDTSPKGTQADDNPPDDIPVTPEFPSYAVPVIAILGIFFILGYRKND